MVDVTTSIDIRRPRAEVAAYATDPDNVTRWYKRIKAVEWKTPKPLEVGSRLAFVAKFLGRRLEYTYEVTEIVPEQRFVMTTAQGPFPMETTYSWEDAMRAGTTTMTLRNRGEPAGFTGLTARFMASSIRRANQKDLAQLKKILEAPILGS